MRLLGLVLLLAVPLVYFACNVGGSLGFTERASAEKPGQARAAGAKPRRIAPRVRRMPAKPHERLTIALELGSDSESQREARAGMVAEWQAFRTRAQLTPKQERAVLAAIYDMSQELQRVTDDEVATGYEPVNVGKLRGAAAHERARDLLDEREAQLAEVAGSALMIAADGFSARMREILTPDQLDAWTIAPWQIDIVRDFVAVAE